MKPPASPGTVVDTTIPPQFEPPGPPDPAPRRMRQRYERARTRRDMFSAVVDDCYEFAMPLRQRGYMSKTRSTPDLGRMFDGTAQTCIQSLASQTLDDVWPAEQTPFTLKAGRDVPDDKRQAMDQQLSLVAAEIIQVMNNSNFRSAGHECFLDYCIATGVMLIERGDALQPVNFRSVPLTQCVLDLGPRNEVDALFMPRDVQIQHIRELWPKAKLPQRLADRLQREPEAEVTVIEGVERDWTKRNREVWQSRVLWMDGNDDEGFLSTETSEGAGSCPFVAPSFSRVAGEAMGRGPVMMALPDIRTVNALTELNLETIEMHAMGVWVYDDNGVINADTAIIQPGAMIPRLPGQTNGSGLQNVAPTGNPNIGRMEIERLQSAIKEALYFDDLGDVNRSPKTATEISQRTANVARRKTGAYGRLLTEFLHPAVARVWFLLKSSKGAKGLPGIDGNTVALRPLSPITRAQSQDDVLRTTAYLSTIGQLFGPQAPLLVADTDKLLPYLAEKMGYDAANLRTNDQQQGLLQQAMAMMQQQQAAAAGAAPAEGAAPPAAMPA